MHLYQVFWKGRQREVLWRKHESNDVKAWILLLNVLGLGSRGHWGGMKVIWLGWGGVMLGQSLRITTTSHTTPWLSHVQALLQPTVPAVTLLQVSILFKVAGCCWMDRRVDQSLPPAHWKHSLIHSLTAGKEGQAQHPTPQQGERRRRGIERLLAHMDNSARGYSVPDSSVTASGHNKEDQK